MGLISNNLLLERFYSGQKCPKEGRYLERSDLTLVTTGNSVYVETGKKFPPSKNNHHFVFVSADDVNYIFS